MKKILALCTSALLGLGLSLGGATMASAVKPDETGKPDSSSDHCNDFVVENTDGWGAKQDTTGDPETVTVHADSGFLIDKYCVKAGDGDGAAYIHIVNPALATVVIDHNPKNSVSHYVVHQIPAPTAATATLTSTHVGCVDFALAGTNSGTIAGSSGVTFKYSLNGGSPTAVNAGTYTAANGLEIGTYVVTATAPAGQKFSNDSSTLVLGPITFVDPSSLDCRNKVTPAVLTLTPGDCFNEGSVNATDTDEYEWVVTGPLSARVYTAVAKGDVVLEGTTVYGPFDLSKSTGQCLDQCTTFADGGVSTNLDANGWTVPADAEYVDGGIRLNVWGAWDETFIERTLTGPLSDLGTGIDFSASSVQYTGIHVVTSAGTLVYEKEPSYAGKWWSNSDFNVASGMGYTTFDTLEAIVSANPAATLLSVKVLYTNAGAASTVITSVSFGCATYTFDKADLATLDTDPTFSTCAAGVDPAAGGLTTWIWVELQEGVQYKIDGVNVDDTNPYNEVTPGPHTVTAEAKPGYTIDPAATVEWNYDVEDSADCLGDDTCIVDSKISTPGEPGGWVAEYGSPTIGTSGLVLSTVDVTKMDYLHPVSLRLDDLDSAGYTVDNIGPAGTPTASFQLTVTGANRVDGTPSGFTTLVWEPYRNGHAIDGDGSFTNIEDGNWWSTRPIAGANGQGDPQLLSHILAHNPNILIGAYRVNLGSGNDGATSVISSVEFDCATTTFEKDQEVVTLDTDPVYSTCAAGVDPAAGGLTTWIWVELQEGVQYKIDGVDANTAYNEVTPGLHQVTAEAKPGYTIDPDAEVEWNYMVEDSADCELITRGQFEASASATNPSCVNPSGWLSFHRLPDEIGLVEYFVDGVSVGTTVTKLNKAPGNYVVTAQAVDPLSTVTSPGPWNLTITAFTGECLPTLAFTGASAEQPLQLAGGMVMLGLLGLYLRRRMVLGASK